MDFQRGGYQPEGDPEGKLPKPPRGGTGQSGGCQCDQLRSRAKELEKGLQDTIRTSLKVIGGYQTKVKELEEALERIGNESVRCLRGNEEVQACDVMKGIALNALISSPCDTCNGEGDKYADICKGCEKMKVDK